MKEARLTDAADGAELTFLPTREVTVTLLGEADAVIGNLPPGRLSNARNPKWIQLGSAGADGKKSRRSGSLVFSRLFSHGPVSAFPSSVVFAIQFSIVSSTNGRLPI